MLAVLAETRSDAATLVVIVRAVSGSPSMPVLQKGYNGCGELCQKGAKQAKAFARDGATRFVVAHDADAPTPDAARAKVIRMIITPAGIAASSCIAVPVYEIEAWLLADETAFPRVVQSFRPKPVAQPEAVPDPKEYLERLSRGENSRPRYAHAIHNEKVAGHLDLGKVQAKCPSFRPLVSFLRGR